MANLLNQDHDRIERMEKDLSEKMRMAYTSVPDLDINVNEVFSLEHLETLRKGDLCNGVTVGIGFLEAMPAVSPQVNQSSPARGSTPVMVDYRFLAVFAVPTEESCGTRHNATALMSVAMDYIHGCAVAEDQTQRAWQFAGQKSETGASTNEVLYYSQVWQIRLPVGKSS